MPVNEFRQECRDFAAHWIKVQTDEFRRLGVEGDFDNPYTTMAFHAEARIAGELLKFAKSGQLYRGSKPVMWSVVERTALAEAEVEYQDYESDTVWVKFPMREGPAAELADASIVIWTTTPWTIPGNRAVSYAPRVAYGLYQVTAAENDFGPQPGEKLVFADALAADAAAKAKVTLERRRGVSVDELAALTLAHPLAGLGGGYLFPVPLLDGEHVTDDAGTGFVHTAPGHGREDFDAWTAAARVLAGRGIDTAIPFTVDDAGFFTADAPGFGPDRDGGAARVIDDHGKKGDANKAVIEALIDAGTCCSPRAAEAFLSALAGAPRSRSSSATRRNGSSTWTRSLAASASTARRPAGPTRCAAGRSPRSMPRASFRPRARPGCAP